MKVMHEIHLGYDGRYYFLCENDEGGIQDEIVRARDEAVVNVGIDFAAAGARPLGQGLATNQATISATNMADLDKIRWYLSEHIGYKKT